jgi:hypothetical protein
MSDYGGLIRKNLHHLRQVEPFLPFGNPTFGNPAFEDTSYHVLIVRLSPFRHVDRSLPHLFLFHEVRQALPGAYIDLAFFPTADQREMFEREGIPFLLGTQSLRAADAFDLVLVSNAYTLELINLPFLLLRSSIPLFASARGPEWPIMLLGGSNALASQAIIGEDGDCLVDGIFFGEGESLVGQIVRLLHDSKESDRHHSLNQAAAQVPGLWAAGSLHETEKAICAPGGLALPSGYPILDTPEAHTANLQISYGCPAFCSFCFEGYDRKPYREIDLPNLITAAREIKRAQGVEELGLYSFNFNTHTDILPMILELSRLFDRVSLKSQRADILQHMPTLLEAEVEAEKRDFTLGIEGISERQRAFLHKSLATSELRLLLDRLLGQRIRRLKLFYVLTGHETEDDIAEFREFVRWFKETRRAHAKRPRVIFSAGLLIRMPFTPLRHDQLMLDQAEWKSIIGPVKSACETNGFEFRLAYDWPAYCVTQVLALGGYWLIEPIVALAQEGRFFDTTLLPEYWDALQSWMREEGVWNSEFLREKGPDYAFPLDFVRSGISGDFLYHQYQEAQAGIDSGYCLGSHDGPGRCLGCDACTDGEQRRAITQHQIRQPERSEYLSQLKATVKHKRELKPNYVRLRVAPWLAGAEPEFLNAFVFRELMARYPEMEDDLLSVRESLFSIKPYARRFPNISGETVFALKAWDEGVLQRALADPTGYTGQGFDILGEAEKFTPGQFGRLHLNLRLPSGFFPEPRARLEAYLREAYVPYSLRRGGDRLGFDLPAKALRKRILLGGFIETQNGIFLASLDVGPKFDLAALLGKFPGENLHHHAQVCASDLQW